MKNYTFIIFILSLVFMGCRKEKFSSESNWIVPVLETNLTLGDIIPDSLLSDNKTDSLALVYEMEYGVSNLDDILEIPDRVELIEVSLSSLVLEDRSFKDTLTLLELYPQSILLHGKMAKLDAQDIVVDEGTVLDVSEEFFTTATFVEGFIDIEISNDLPVTAELLEFELLNYESQTLIVSGVFTDLAPNATVSKSYSLAGKTVDGVLELKVKHIKTKASDGEVYIDANKGIRTTFGVRGLKPQIATAVFPAQDLVTRKEETKYNFGGAELTQVTVKTGYILMKVESSIEESIILDYKIPNSSSPDYEGVIHKKWEIPAAKPGEKVFVEERFPIDGYKILLWGKSHDYLPTFNHIYNELVASIKYSGIERTLSLDDKIKIEFGLVDVKPKLIIGDPSIHRINVNDTLNLNFFNDFSGMLSLENASMDLDFYNSFGIEASLKANNIIGSNTRNNKSVILYASEFQDTILLGRGVNNGYFVEPIERKIHLDKTNSNIKLFIENLPNRIEPNLEVVIRPNGTINQNDFAFDYSELLVNLKLEIPLVIGLDSFTVQSTDDISLFQNEEIESIKQAKLILNLENSFPISGKIELVFMDELGDVLTTAFKGNNNAMSAAEVDRVTNKSVGSVHSEMIAILSREDMTKLQNAKTMKIIVQFNTKDAKRQKMFLDYNIDAKLTTEIIYEKSY